MLHRELLINGIFLGGPCDQGIGKEVARSPWSGQVIGTYAEAGWPEADAAIDAAVNALSRWRDVPHRDRQALCRRIASLIRDRREELANLLVLEVGKPILWARAEIERTAITFELSAEVPQQSEPIALGADSRSVDYEVTSRRFPIGVVLAIAPYNWPFNLAAHKVGPALVTGNTVVLKGSNQAGLCTLTLARLIHEAGCPPGVLNAVQCSVPIAQRMVDDGRINGLSFTGSPGVGWMLKARVPQKRVSLELGGNAFAIVASDTDIDSAISKLVPSGYGYAGQVCISLQHVLVAQPCFDDFWNRFATATAAVNVIDPADPESLCGPLIDDQAAERVHQWVLDSECDGLSGELMRTKNRLSPVAVRVNEFGAAQQRGIRLVTDEVFGPVVTVSPYDDLDDAITWVNRSQFGIHTSYFGGDVGDIDRLFDALDVSGMVVNDAPTIRFDAMPYGGQKRSGFGREGVRYAAEEFTTPKVRVHRR